MRDYFFSFTIICIMKYGSNNTFCSLRDSLSGRQFFNSWNCKVVRVHVIIELHIPSHSEFMIATNEKDLLMKSVMLQQWPFC